MKSRECARIWTRIFTNVRIFTNMHEYNREFIQIFAKIRELFANIREIMIRENS
jgi:hypothetical protein